MPKRGIDMTGEVCGKLTVLSEAEPEVNPKTGAKFARWLCRCDCGNETIKRGTALRNGQAKSCGCARKTSLKGSGLRDLSGQRFGRWIVRDRAGSDAHRQALWNCICDCGETGVVAGGSLRRGDSQSCGCLKLENLQIERDLVGEKCGRWAVTAVASTDSPRTWMCECECGTKREVSEASLVRGVSTSCGCLRNERSGAAAKARTLDLVGERYGKLTVVSSAGLVHYPGGAKTSVWNCVCDCGTEKTIPMPTLRSGSSQSCGCATGSRMEAYVRDFCMNHAIPFTPQRSFPDLRGSGGRPLAFDFEVMTPSGLVLIECQGEQHFRPVKWFGGDEKFAEQQKNDQAKRDYTKKLGEPLLEIHFSVNTSEKIEEYLKRELAGFWVDANEETPWGDDE